jgi:hypothetical protein
MMNGCDILIAGASADRARELTSGFWARWPCASDSM